MTEVRVCCSNQVLDATKGGNARTTRSVCHAGGANSLSTPDVGKLTLETCRTALQDVKRRCVEPAGVVSCWLSCVNRLSERGAASAEDDTGTTTKRDTLPRMLVYEDHQAAGQRLLEGSPPPA